MICACFLATLANEEKLLGALKLIENEKFFFKKKILYPFLANLEDEIIFKGGRICKAQNVYKKKNINNKINI
jgi:hypothetical protein